MSCAAVIVAAGNSQRMGFDKLGAPLGGGSVLQSSIAVFLGMPEFAPVIVVCPPARFADVPPEIAAQVRRVDGGRQRCDSVAAGLAAVPDTCTHVAVHDAARPLVQPGDIRACLLAAQACGAAALAKPVADTLRRATPEGLSDVPVPREELWAMETPQIFELALLRRAYAACGSDPGAITDEVAALEHIGHRARLVPSQHPNFKITRPADLWMAEAILDRNARRIP